MAAAERAYVDGLAIERTQDNPAGLADALYNLGFVRGVAGNLAEARTLYEEALEIAGRSADQASVLRYQEGLAFAMFHMGEFAAARQLQEQNVAAFKAAKEPFRAAVGSGFLSYLEAKDGRYGIARDMQREAFDVFRAADDRHWMVRELMVAAASAVIVGDLTLAAKLCGAYDVLREPLGEMATPIKTLNLPDPMVQARDGLGEDAFAGAYAAGRAMSLDEVTALLR
jgi:tetratricopeptide (TPR) repeat protein